MPAGDIDSSRPLHCFAQIWSFHQLLVKIHYFQKGVAFPGHWRHFPIIGRHFPVNPPAFPDHWPAFPGHWFFAILAVSPISANDASGCKCGSQGHLMTDFVAVIQRKVCSEPLTSTLIEFS